MTVSEEKIKEIKKQLRKGIPEGEIKEILKREGYSEENIKQIFKPHKYDMRSWYLSFAILLLIAGIWNLQNNSLLLFFLSALLFLAYSREVERLKNQ